LKKRPEDKTDYKEKHAGKKGERGLMNVNKVNYSHTVEVSPIDQLLTVEVGKINF